MKKFIFGFLVGGFVFGIPSYFITKKLVEDRCQQEVNELKAYYKNKYEKETGKEEEEAIKNHTKKVPDKPIPPEYKELISGYRPEDPKDAPDEYYEEDPADLESPPEDRPLVEIISQEEYDDIDHRYEKSCLIWYTEDEQLATEEGEMIDNEKYLLEDALDVDGWRRNDDMKENLYVRNDKISEMFEVAKCFGSYGDLN